MVDKLPFLPDEHHFAIAAVATRSAQLDHHIEFVINLAFLDRQHAAKFILKNLNGERMVGLLGAALHDVVPTHGESIDSLIAEINRRRGERNEILHWLWGKSDGDPGSAIHATIRPFRESRSSTKTAGQIQAVADAMLEIIRTLLKWQDFISHIRLGSPLQGTSEPPIHPLSSDS
jgi:hypothetical protein